MSSMFNSTQLGRFIIDISHIRSKSNIVPNILSLTIPIKIIHYTDDNVLEYLAISDLFDELNDDELIPLYNFQMDGVNEFQKVIRMDYNRKSDSDSALVILELLNQHKININEFKTWAVKHGDTIEEKLKHYGTDFLNILKIYIEKNKL